METLEKNQYILVYSIDSNDCFTSFLPFNLSDEKDKKFFDYLMNSNNQNNNYNFIKLPIDEKNYNYLFELKVANFESITVSKFFKQYNLEEWVL